MVAARSVDNPPNLHKVQIQEKYYFKIFNAESRPAEAEPCALH